MRRAAPTSKRFRLFLELMVEVTVCAINLAIVAAALLIYWGVE